MKQILQKLLLPAFFWIAVSSAMVFAKYHEVKSDVDFNKLINQYQYSVACFAPAQGANDEKEDFKDLQNRVKAASKYDDFKLLKKDVGFLMVDTASKKAQDLRISNMLDF
jgi:hypothetical protein